MDIIQTFYDSMASQYDRLFQNWHREGSHYKLVQYIIDDEDQLQVSKFQCEYRATHREEISQLLLASGCSEAAWLFPEGPGFYQPIVVARKQADA